ncbi:DNA binding domain-containing protein, excisionase family [Streptoalloteichus tenebrarius]|uniref:DNA binding domain-containing protein, excisionase family n=1 Tax=Streptoalloteichus tenebrarius (strain ATCC 17920 / DSM 40477 / JCM 4838 / CBS 697.72 / NBRC 16177 / NCIMB 11028 / NRRL B-12390 / A12253. 1 / ISP 5477) TaxID=1933 RepID=A0ABT1HTL0_STRSD|nr:helix-turn-helix domain-containing protein [Streptoalloteichus tenebrarius]MCP2258849.1 DNA binding domain-containing protein, excisionase family [Streptoalloteichus tenebrarius]BFE99466.1 helix-turn-helix domain-containing protein [Streptoalloteichus tenebrarius]
MREELFSVEQVAEKLGLHVRTVRNYVRDGRLKAVRIGKQYRIAASDLAEFTGLSGSERASTSRDVEVTSVVRIEGVDAADADRLATHLLASVQTRSGDGRTLRIETSHDRERSRMRIIVLGEPELTADVLRLIAALTEAMT